MKKFIFFTFIISGILYVSLCGNILTAKVKYNTYSNSRFGYSIDYPSDFKKGEAPVNNDGRTFTSPDGKAQLSVHGYNNVIDETVNSLYKETLNNITGKVSYKVVKNNWFVISWVNEEGNIVYQKTFIGKGSVNTFIIFYPKSQSKYYNDITAHIEKSFKPGDLRECY